MIDDWKNVKHMLQKVILFQNFMLDIAMAVPLPSCFGYAVAGDLRSILNTVHHFHSVTGTAGTLSLSPFSYPDFRGATQWLQWLFRIS